MVPKSNQSVVERLGSRIIPNAEGFTHLESVKLLTQHNVQFRFIELERTPKSAQEVEQMFGCKLKQVVKTLLLVGDLDVLVCVPGDRRVDFGKIKELLNVSNLRMASPQEVQQKTGFVVGGVCPFMEKSGMMTILDTAVLENEVVNVGAGTTTTGVELKSAELRRVWKGAVESIRGV